MKERKEAQMGQDGKRYVSTTEAAKRLKSTPQTIRNRFRRGDLLGVQVWNPRTGQTEIRIEEECLGPPNPETGRGTDIGEVRHEDVVRRYSQDIVGELARITEQGYEAASLQRQEVSRTLEKEIRRNREVVSGAIERQHEGLLDAMRAHAEEVTRINRDLLERQEDILGALLRISDGLQERRERRSWWRRLFSEE